VPEPEESQEDIEIEEMSLEDLDQKDEAPKKDRPKSGGFRAGGLGPEGRRYVPPSGPRRKTWKPVAAAFMLFFAGVLGIFSLTLQVTIDDMDRDDTWTLKGEVWDKEEYDDNNEEISIPGVKVTLDGLPPVISDADGKFEIEDIPGTVSFNLLYADFTLSFEKRSWNQAIDTTYNTYVLMNFDQTERRWPFLVVVNDLDPNGTRPAGFNPSLNAEVLDWPTPDIVKLRVALTSFDTSLQGYKLVFREAGDSSASPGDYNYTPEVEYSFRSPTGMGDYSSLEIRAMSPSGENVTDWTKVMLPDHPVGDGGWEGTDFPDVALFVKGGSNTNGTARTVLVHSNGGERYRYRVDGGSWEDWSDLDDGGAKFEWTPPTGLTEHMYAIDVMVQNATMVNGTSVTEIFYDAEPPTLAPFVIGEKAIAPWAHINVSAEGAAFLRYKMPDGTFVPWQLYSDKLLVPIPAEGDSNTVEVEVMDRALNTAKDTVTVEYEPIPVYRRDDTNESSTGLLVCLPIIILGIILTFLGGYMALKRKRPGLAMLGAIGALLASGLNPYALIAAVIALVLVTLSREEFEEFAPTPEEPEPED
jgi:hypothetical protein